MGSDAAVSKRRKHKLIFGLLIAPVVILLFISFLPVLETYRWWVRMADFPRLQVAILLLLFAIPVAFYLRYFRKGAGSMLALMAAALGYQAFMLLPYAPLGAELAAGDCPPGTDFSVMVANVQITNDPGGRLIEIVREVEPDVLLAMETTEKWDKALAPLAKTMPHTIAHVSDSAFSIHLFSRLPLESPEIRFLAGQETPQIVTGVRLGNDKIITLYGVHPRPPSPSQSALGRDAVLYEAAFMARDSSRPAVVAGDLNATPWESATSRMREIGSLEDPRRGYGYVPTFDANSWWMSWPLDQIFHQPGFVVLSLERLPYFGSDHFPFFGRFCWIGEPVGESPPGPDQEELRSARQTIDRATAGKE